MKLKHIQTESDHYLEEQQHSGINLSKARSIPWSSHSDQDHCLLPSAPPSDALLISSLCVMKAAERGQGGLHGSQLRPAGQSEAAASANGSSQVAEDHQDAGKLPFNP